MPAPRIDWQTIRDRFSPDEPILFCLPRRFQQLLLSDIDRLTWEATFREYGYDFADWDDLQTTVELGTAQLLGGVPLDEIIQYIDDVETLLQEIRDRPCCDDGTFIFDQTQDPGGIIQTEQDDTGTDVVVYQDEPPGELPDWDAYESHLCDAATKFAEGLPKLMDILASVSELTNIALALSVTFLLSAFAGLGLVGTAIAGALSTTLSLSFLDNLRSILGQNEPFAAEKAELEAATLQNAVVCAIVTSATASEAYGKVSAALTEHAPNAAPYAQWFPLQFALNKVFNADSDAAGGFGGGCANCFDFDLTYTFDTDTEGWASVRQAPWDAENGGSIKVYGFTNDGDLRLFDQLFRTDTGILGPVDIRIHRFSFDFRMDSQGNSGEARVSLIDESGTITTVFDQATYDGAGWQSWEFDLSEHDRITISDASPGGNIIQFAADRYSTTMGTEFRFYVDNVHIKGTIIT